jgi:hypothetical protein
MADAGDGGLIQHTAARAHLRRELDRDMFFRHMGDPLKRSFALVLNLILQRAGRRRQLDREAYTITGDLHILDHLTRNQIAAKLGLLHCAKSLQYQLLAELIAISTRE